LGKIGDSLPGKSEVKIDECIEEKDVGKRPERGPLLIWVGRKAHRQIRGKQRTAGSEKIKASLA